LNLREICGEGDDPCGYVYNGMGEILEAVDALGNRLTVRYEWWGTDDRY
jgi:hypothetical protein